MAEPIARMQSPLNQIHSVITTF